MQNQVFKLKNKFLLSEKLVQYNQHQNEFLQFFMYRLDIH